MRQTIFAQILLIIVLVVGLFMVPTILEGSAKLIGLEQSGSISGILSQALGADGKHMPTAGKDFTIKSIQNFDNGQWVVASLTTAKVSDLAFVVLHKQSGTYVVQFGPSTQFDYGTLKSVPSDVIQFLNQKGAVDVSN